MSNWELITEVKDTGYYIGWRRVHKYIHIPEPMQPMSKTSLVQIAKTEGTGGSYEVRGLTYAHSVFEPHKAGLKLFDETHHCITLGEARAKTTELKLRITKLFDEITRSDETGKLILRPDLMTV